MALESANIPLPSEVIMPLSGWLLVREAELGWGGVLLAGFYGGLGCTLGSLASYALGAWGGRPFLIRYGKYLLVSHHDLDRADRWFARYGDLAVFLSRLLPVVRTFISLPAGISRVNLPRFIAYTFVGSFIWCLGLATGGYYLGANWERLRAAMRPFDIPILAAFAALIILYLYRHLRPPRATQAPGEAHHLDHGKPES
ncbi:MAG: DedA family protein [Dehalococcoidia bacterium]|nr:DedA family protein [Dehalococcoidia bacterium]